MLEDLNDPDALEPESRKDFVLNLLSEEGPSGDAALKVDDFDRLSDFGIDERESGTGGGARAGGIVRDRLHELSVFKLSEGTHDCDLFITLFAVL